MSVRIGSMSKSNRKMLVVLLVTCLVASFSFGYAAYAESGGTGGKKGSSASGSHRTKSDKERVYVLQKPDGEPYQRIVNNDGSLQYEGYEEAELPVTMDVTYSLDGEKISPRKLAGKSGHVVIEIDYQSNVEVDNTPVPFMALTGAIFSNENFSNVSVSPGKIIDDGSNAIAVGFAFPGVQQGLAVSSNLLEIPHRVFIQADTDNYDMGEIYTVLTSDPFKEVDLSEVTDVDGLLSRIDELKGAAGKLADGTQQLKEGAGKLNGGARQLNKASKKLVAGTKQVSQGNGVLNKKVPTLTKGVGELATGSKALSQGNAGLLAGLQQLYGHDVDKDKGWTEAAGTVKLKKGSKQLAEGAKNLHQEVEKIKLPEVALTEEQKNQISQQAASSEAVSGAAAQLTEGIAQGVSGNLQASLTSNETIGSIVSSQQGQNIIQQLVDEGLSEEQAASIVQNTVGLSVNAAAGGITPETISGAIRDSVSDTMGKVAGGAALSGAEGVVDAVNQKLGSFGGKMDALKEATGQLADGAAQVDGGIEGVNKALSQQIIPGADKLADGSDAVYAGIVKLQGGSKTLAEGVNKLHKGSMKLYKGMVKFSGGEAQLAKGTEKLAKGAKTLNSAVDGAMDEAKKQLGKLDDSNMLNVIENAKSVNKAALGYGSFEGTGSYQQVSFIYKIDGVSPQ